MLRVSSQQTSIRPNPTTAPLIPGNAPFSAEQRAWLNGFLAGWLGAEQPGASAPATASRPLAILYGSQSGTSESLAKKIGREAKARGFAPQIAELNAVKPSDLARESHALIVTSTWGEGEMPDNAKDFWEGLSNGGISLAGLKYSVLALGDTNYGETFCWAGRSIDARLAELGAQRVCDRVDCDTDYEKSAEMWIASALAALGGAVEVSTEETEKTESQVYSKKNLFPAALLVNRALTGAGSGKDVRHFEFSLEGLAYEVGDALGVQAKNCPVFVEEILDAAGLSGGEPVILPDGSTTSVHEALLAHYELRPFVVQLPAKTGSAAALVENLKRLAPRLYSISSSPKAHPGRVHLTVATVRFESGGKARKGACSTFLADRLPVGGTAGVFIQTSHGFRPPTDPGKPMIMVGPGTGIAPFRAFLEEREATDAKGKNWLFFGDQHAATDFLYREQLTGWVNSGLLTRLDTAFSRDQADKIYVQHRMLERAAEIWTWLGEGAYFYVCGDASRMAKDVDAALHRIVREQGAMDEASAIGWIKQLKKEKRYERDIY